MEVVLVRHGPAADRDPSRWPDDRQRPLTPDGIRATGRAAQGLATLRPKVDRIVTSGAQRAWATAEIVRTALGIKRPLETWDELAPDEPAGPVLERLSNLSGAPGIVVVSHEPTLGELIGLAVAGEAVPIARVSRAGAAWITFPQAPRPGAGQIGWVLTREQLERLA
jgi:phosphohistidine phosphatase